MSGNVAVYALVFLGMLITVLGFFAGGNVTFVVIGLAAIAVGGLLQVMGSRRSG